MSYAVLCESCFRHSEELTIGLALPRTCDRCGKIIKDRRQIHAVPEETTETSIDAIRQLCDRIAESYGVSRQELARRLRERDNRVNSLHGTPTETRFLSDMFLLGE